MRDRQRIWFGSFKKPNSLRVWHDQLVGISYGRHIYIPRINTKQSNSYQYTIDYDKYTHFRFRAYSVMSAVTWPRDEYNILTSLGYNGNQGSIARLLMSSLYRQYICALFSLDSTRAADNNGYVCGLHVPNSSSVFFYIKVSDNGDGTFDVVTKNCCVSGLQYDKWYFVEALYKCDYKEVVYINGIKEDEVSLSESVGSTHLKFSCNRTAPFYGQLAMWAAAQHYQNNDLYDFAGPDSFAKIEQGFRDIITFG